MLNRLTEIDNRTKEVVDWFYGILTFILFCPRSVFFSFLSIVS